MRQEKTARRRRCLIDGAGLVRGAFGDHFTVDNETGQVALSLRSVLESVSRLRLIGALSLPSRGQVQNTKIHFNPLPQIQMTHRAPPAKILWWLDPLHRRARVTSHTLRGWRATQTLVLATTTLRR